VRHPGGEAADGGHLLRLDQQLLDALALGDVVDDPLDQRHAALGVVDGVGGDRAPDELAVLAPEPHLAVHDVPGAPELGEQRVAVRWLGIELAHVLHVRAEVLDALEAHELEPRGVGVDQRPGGCRAEDADARRLEDAPVLGLGCPQLADLLLERAAHLREHVGDRLELGEGNVGPRHVVAAGLVALDRGVQRRERRAQLAPQQRPDQQQLQRDHHDAADPRDRRDAGQEALSRTRADAQPHPPDRLPFVHDRAVLVERHLLALVPVEVDAAAVVLDLERAHDLVLRDRGADRGRRLGIQRPERKLQRALEVTEQRLRTAVQALVIAPLRPREQRRERRDRHQHGDRGRDQRKPAGDAARLGARGLHAGERPATRPGRARGRTAS
jgi:hypothetical protein